MKHQELLTRASQPGVVVIYVRTAGEYAQGLIDLQAAGASIVAG